MATNTITINDVVWDKDKIVELLDKNDSAVIRGMLRIYEYQTTDEKCMTGTISDNGVGFSSYHGTIMSSLVNFYNTQGFLTIKQLAVARKIMKKYSGQLFKIMSLLQ